MKLRNRLWILAALSMAVILVAGAWAAQPRSSAKTSSMKEAKPQEMAGTISSFSVTKLVLSHEVRGKKTETPFVLDPDTQIQGTLANGAKVTVWYHVESNENVATKVVVQEAKHAAKSTSSTPKY